MAVIKLENRELEKVKYIVFSTLLIIHKVNTKEINI